MKHIIVILLLVSFSKVSAQGDPKRNAVRIPIQVDTISGESITKILDAVNKYRANPGKTGKEVDVKDPLPPLKFDSTMSEKALKKAVYIATRQVLSHKNANGTYGMYSGECLSWLRADEDEAHVANFISDFNIPDKGHRRALLGGFHKIGIALVNNNRGESYCVLVFQ